MRNHLVVVVVVVVVEGEMVQQLVVVAWLLLSCVYVDVFHQTCSSLDVCLVCLHFRRPPVTLLCPRSSLRLHQVGRDGCEADVLLSALLWLSLFCWTSALLYC